MNNATRRKLIDKQFNLPNTDTINMLAHNYPQVSWEEAMHLYSLSVYEVLVYYHASNIFDPPLDWGRGLVYVRNLFQKKLQNITKIKNKQEAHKY